jgi:Ca2+-transporting ATPase
MKRPPYTSTESVFGRGMLTFILGMGAVMSLVSLVVGLIAYRMGVETWQTLLFTTLIFSQLAVALEARSEQESLFKTGLLTNRSMVWAILLTVALQLAVIYLPFFQHIFDTQALSSIELLAAFLASLVVLLVVEIWKLFSRRR